MNIYLIFCNPCRNVNNSYDCEFAYEDSDPRQKENTQLWSNTQGLPLSTLSCQLTLPILI